METPTGDRERHCATVFCPPVAPRKPPPRAAQDSPRAGRAPGCPGRPPAGRRGHLQHRHSWALQLHPTHSCALQPHSPYSLTAPPKGTHAPQPPPLQGGRGWRRPRRLRARRARAMKVQGGRQSARAGLDGWLHGHCHSVPPWASQLAHTAVRRRPGPLSAGRHQPGHADVRRINGKGVGRMAARPPRPRGPVNSKHIYY